MALTDRDRAILDFERSWWAEAALADVPMNKVAAIRAHLNLSAARYYELLSALVASPEAVRYDPLVVLRLRRRQSHRRRVRIEGPFVGQPPSR